MAAHLGGELSYHYGLRVDRNAFEETGPDGFTPVLGEDELPETGMRRVEVEGVGILLSRSSSGEVCAIAATCNHFSGPLEEGDREGTPWCAPCTVPASSCAAARSSTARPSSPNPATRPGCEAAGSR